MADAIAAYPKRFSGVFSVDVLAADAVEKMKHWMSNGFSGMRLSAKRLGVEKCIKILGCASYDAACFRTTPGRSRPRCERSVVPA